MPTESDTTMQTIKKHESMSKPRINLGRGTISKHYSRIKVRLQPSGKPTRATLNEINKNFSQEREEMEIELPVKLKKYLSRLPSRPPRQAIGYHVAGYADPETLLRARPKQRSNDNRISKSRISRHPRSHEDQDTKRRKWAEKRGVQMEFESVLDKWAALDKGEGSEEIKDTREAESSDQNYSDRPRSIGQIIRGFFTSEDPQKCRKHTKDSGNGGKPGFFG
jgi:hypothetical protein